MAETIFKGTPQLETERLILRKLVPQDERDVFEYASDPEVSKFTFWNAHKSIEDSRNFINSVLEKYIRDEAGEWGIVLKENSKVIGSLGLLHLDTKNRLVQMGYVLSRHYWGKGIMPEAVKRVLKFGFEEMELNRIECYHLLPNEKSGRVMQKAGMSFEGIARKRSFVKGRYWDVKQYAILCSDWTKE